MRLWIIIVAHLFMGKLSRSSTEVVRGPVNHAVIIPLDGSCLGQEDGIKCNKKCQDLTCSSVLARCFQVLSDLIIIHKTHSLISLKTRRSISGSDCKTGLRERAKWDLRPIWDGWEVIGKSSLCPKKLWNKSKILQHDRTGRGSSVTSQLL